MWPFSHFQYRFRSSKPAADLLTVVSDRIPRAFNRSGATWTVVLDTYKAFDRVWHAGLLHKLRSYGISGQIFGLISSFLSNRQLWVILGEKSSQDFLQGPFLVLHFSYYTLMTFLTLSAILLSMLMWSGIWSVEQLEFASEPESDLQDTVDWGKKWLVDFNAGKTHLVSFDQSNNTGAIDVKMGGSVLEERSSFKMLGLTFSSEFDLGSYIVLHYR